MHKDTLTNLGVQLVNREQRKAALEGEIRSVEEEIKSIKDDQAERERQRSAETKATEHLRAEICVSTLLIAHNAHD